MLRSKIEKCYMETRDKKDESETNFRGILWPEIVKIMNIDSLMSGETKAGETSTEKIRMVRAVLLETATPSKIQPRSPLFQSSFHLRFSFSFCWPHSRFWHSSFLRGCLQAAAGIRPLRPPPHPGAEIECCWKIIVGQILFENSEVFLGKYVLNIEKESSKDMLLGNIKIEKCGRRMLSRNVGGIIFLLPKYWNIRLDIIKIQIKRCSLETRDKKEKNRPISASKKFRKCWNIEFLMSGNKKSGQNSSGCFRMVLGVSWNSLNPFKCHADLRQTTFSYEADFICFCSFCVFFGV
jgi:hypothetical protein